MQRQPQMNSGAGGGGQQANGQNGGVARMPGFVRKMEGVSSLFQIDVKPGSKCYQYDVDVRSLIPSRHGLAKERMLTRGSDE